MTIVLLTILVIYVTMVYAPIAAWLVELFPTRIRYSGLSLPYHIGNGWFGGFLPATVFAIVAATGNIYSGPLVSDRGRGDELRRRPDLPAGDQGSGYHPHVMDRRAAAHSRSLLTASPAPIGAGLFLIGSARFPVPTCGRSATLFC